ncbi:MAG: cupredoxin domain-containing protein [Armatimonadetes bacterium]|nr:cupredoxin domain-containing protein [Armatimonadota bacterium]
MDRQTAVGVALIAVGIAGLLLGGPGWGGPDGSWWPHHGPMMRGFGRHPMSGPWWGPEGSGQPVPPVAGARTIEIVATDFAFTPAEITVRAGEVVNIRLVNRGVTLHDIVIPAQEIWIVAPEGESAITAFRAGAPGTYEFFCSVPGHREAGMVGRIIVTP